MNNGNDNSDRLNELAHLPPHHPHRRELEGLLASMPADERARWDGILLQTDELYSWMAEVQMPAGLEETLLRIPRKLPQTPKPAAAPFWRNLSLRKILFMPVPMWVPAACILLAICNATYQLLPIIPRDHTAPVLDQQIALSLTREVVHLHESPMALEVADADSTRVIKALAAHNLPFPVSMLFPDGAPLALRGGGVCNIEGVPAAYTRWVGDGLTYSLYQFDGTKLGMPADFRISRETPSDLWHDNKHYRVVIWSDDSGKSTWALVLENEKAQDVFCMLDVN
jgi:hypothetical protein